LNFLQTKFKEVWRKVRRFCSKNFELFRIVWKRKTFWNLFDFCEIFRFFEKNWTFPEVQCWCAQQKLVIAVWEWYHWFGVVVCW
jgi:hypothetical protein